MDKKIFEYSIVDSQMYQISKEGKIPIDYYIVNNIHLIKYQMKDADYYLVKEGNLDLPFGRFHITDDDELKSLYDKQDDLLKENKNFILSFFDRLGEV